MRRLVKDVLVSFETQLTTSDHHIELNNRELEDHHNRLKELEFLVYKTENSKNRLDDIYKEMSEMVS